MITYGYNSFKGEVDSVNKNIVLFHKFLDLGRISAAPGFDECNMVDLGFACPCVGEADFPEVKAHLYIIYLLQNGKTFL